MDFELINEATDIFLLVSVTGSDGFGLLDVVCVLLPASSRFTQSKTDVFVSTCEVGCSAPVVS